MNYFRSFKGFMKGTGLTIGAAIFWSSWGGKGFFRKPALDFKSEDDNAKVEA